MGKLVVLKNDGGIETIEQDAYPQLDQLSKLVGGYIELQRVIYDGAERDMYINEEGKFDDTFNVNHAATKAWLTAHPQMKGRDVIVGPAVIVIDLVEPEDDE